MDFQESALIHQQKQEQPRPPHGHRTRVSPPPSPSPSSSPSTHTLKQEQSNSYMFPAKIIFHQPQNQKKRGRPRKSFVHGLGLSSSKISESRGASTSEKPSKKTCGRPQSFGEKNQPQDLDAVEARWTRHLISVHIGEDIVGNLITFLQRGPRPRAVCVISATGVVSSVKLRESIIGGGTVIYEGQYDIISLSSSLLLLDDNDSPGITGGLSVLLSRPDGSNICGIVAEMLKASSPVELIVSSYIPEKEKPMPEASSSIC